MKAIIEIDLRADGKYLKSDKELVKIAIMDSFPSMWFIEDERLVILAIRADCKIEESHNEGKP